MPHQCTTCGRTFPDGSKEMLSGCPDCGGNKFQFKPAGATTDDQSPPDEQSVPNGRSPPDETERPTPESPDPTGVDATDAPEPTPPVDADSTPADSTRVADEEAASTRQPSANAQSTSSAASDAAIDDSTTGTEHVRERDEEDTAQASARSDVVSPDELDRASQPVDSNTDARDAPNPDESHPDIDELRDELNDQFESIRIVSPGKYELNLMELYDRQEYIISLQEDGRYVIEMPDAWGIQDE
ncbi:Zn-ribbon containing protein [Halorubrum sp. AD140]|uniref:Zn-ribbon domain-containing protein n=1 Tax=Halorubrum sp. AD140 TaxID=3050073 RepID=UPI002ACCD12D|nr:Zn-ribbon containing protein [Halorubrum sp. AD140]MDZ5810692.1 Zn-ribbon containing protein [Halorubrum sp. AD140]